MRQIRIYINAPLQPDLITLDDSAYQHLITVLRLKIGAAVQLFNSDNQEYAGFITQINKKNCIVQLTEACPLLPASPLHTHLGLGIMKGDRMDFAIQKSVELGVNEITPLFTQFTDVALNAERTIKKHQHWQKIALHACEQCGRSDIPIIHPATPFSHWIQQKDQEGLQVILHPHTQQLTQTRFADALNNTHRLRAAIGPEGGFNSQEIELAMANNFHSMQLGPRILRGETAPLVFLSIVQWLKGDF